MNLIDEVHASSSQTTIPRRICGDWNAKIKLLRRVSNGPVLGFHFSSDYSHHFGGYKAKVFIKNGTLGLLLSCAIHTQHTYLTQRVGRNVSILLHKLP